MCQVSVWLINDTSPNLVHFDAQCFFCLKGVHISFITSMTHIHEGKQNSCKKKKNFFLSDGIGKTAPWAFANKVLLSPNIHV